MSAASQDRQGEFCINDSVSKQNQSATLPGFTSPPPTCHTPSADPASYSVDTVLANQAARGDTALRYFESEPAGGVADKHADLLVPE